MVQDFGYPDVSMTACTTIFPSMFILLAYGVVRGNPLGDGWPLIHLIAFIGQDAADLPGGRAFFWGPAGGRRRCPGRSLRGRALLRNGLRLRPRGPFLLGACRFLLLARAYLFDFRRRGRRRGRCLRFRDRGRRRLRRGGRFWIRWRWSRRFRRRFHGQGGGRLRRRGEFGKGDMINGFFSGGGFTGKLAEGSREASVEHD